MVVGFPPIAGDDARVLVLGTCPSIASLAAEQYYAHPRNAFWPIMEALFAGGQALDYAGRRRLLITNRVALWDVLKAAERPGSLDSSIVRGTETVNDFTAFFAEHPAVHTVFLNGGAAETLFRRHVAGSQRLPEGLATVRLPSTSPAHAGRDFAAKLSAWAVVRDAARTDGSLHR